jgi:hypothetical protein
MLCFATPSCLTWLKLAPAKLPAHIHPERITASTTVSAAAGARAGAVVTTAAATTASAASSVTLLLVRATSPRFDTRGAATRPKLLQRSTSIMGLRLAAVAGAEPTECCCCRGEVGGEACAAACCCWCWRWCCHSVCCSCCRWGVAGMMMHTDSPSGWTQQKQRKWQAAGNSAQQ